MVEENTNLEQNWVPEWLYSEFGEFKQKPLIKKYWEEIEKKFQISPDWVDEFIIDYVSLKSDEGLRDSYSSKQNLVNLLKSHTEEDLESMLRYADYYSEYILANDPDYDTEKKELRNLRLTGYTPAILIMKLHDLLDSKKLDEETYKKMLSSLESYRIRLAVTGKPNHWEIFYKMTPKVSENDPLKSFLSAMNDIPDDDKFREELKKTDFYGWGHMSYDWCRLILYRLQGYSADGQSPTEQYFQIEHVMPQTHNNKWDDVNIEDHEIWCNRIGNLTLVPSINLNQLLSDKPFNKKKKIVNSYYEIAKQFQFYHPDKTVWENEKWTIEEIEERGKYLADQAVEVWPHSKKHFDETLTQ